MSFHILSTATPEMIDRVRIYAGAGDTGVEGDADTLVRELVRDLLTASTEQVLHDAGAPSVRGGLPDVPLTTLLHDRLSHLVEALKIQAFHRFVFHSVMQREHDFAAGGTRIAYATYLQPRFALISEDQAREIRNRLNAFLDRWVPTWAFWDQVQRDPARDRRSAA